MVVDFKKLNLKERPTLILRNMDCVAFGVLGRAFNLTADLKFNEVSSISFDYPAIDNGEPVPFYSQIRALGIIEVKDLGQFILEEAKRTTDGIREVKHCTAYSLEYELSYKQFFAEKGTYNFWNPVAPENTILGMILETVPYWSLGDIDPALIGKYRTFEAENENVHEFIKNTVQSAYGCIFTFDTYTRKINVTSVASFIPTSQVFLSLDNLIKDIEVTESTENHITCIDPYGADGLSIRSVNPTGTNKIINLDYFMIKENVSQAIIDKWAVWKKLFDDRQLPFYNLTIEESIQSSRLLTEKSVLTDMKGELKKLEALQSASVQYLGEHPHDATEQKKLDKINADIAAQKNVIKAQDELLVTIQTNIDAVTAEKTAINKELAFETVFTADEVSTISKYIKESSLQDSSFVVSTVKDYNTADSSSKHENAVFGVSNAVITRIANQNNKELYSIVGGALTCPCGEKALSSNMVRGTLERKNDGNFVFSAYLNTGKIGDAAFPSGNISVTGTAGAVSTDVVPDTDAPDAYETGTRLSFTASTARVYFTQNATEYEAQSVQFDLYDYAKTCLSKVSVPSYSFSLNSANFLALDEFLSFKDNFTLGQRVYLDIEAREVPTKILKPIVIGIKIDFETLSNFSLEFSNKFTTSDAAPSIVEMLQPSISMGKKFNAIQHSTTAFTDSGAAGTIESYIRNALDVSKQEILATVGQAFTLDENGFRMRKWLADRSSYEPEQIWMNNNTINFTSDNWNTVRTALGKVQIGEQTLYGLVAEVIVGHSILGKNFTISSEKEHGGIQEFRIDGAGVRMYNGAFYLTQDGGGQIVLTAADGILLGTVGLFTFDENGVATVDKSKANMWLDMNGFIHTTGDITAKNLYFLDGTDVKTLLSESTKKIDSKYLDLGKIQLDGDAGDITMSGTLNLSDVSKIIFGKNSFVQTRYSTNKNATIPGGWKTTWDSSWSSSSVEVWAIHSYNGGETWDGPLLVQGKNGQNGAPGSPGDPKGYLESIRITEIDGTSIKSAQIEGATIAGANMYGGRFGDVPPKDPVTDLYGEPTVWLEMGKSSGGLGGYSMKLFHKEYSVPLMEVRDDSFGETALRMKNKTVFTQENYITKPKGDWDFSAAESVKGIPIRFGE